MKIPTDMATGSKFKSNGFGFFTVINYESALKVCVEFDDTGYKTTARSDHIRAGRVKDKLFRGVYGVGFIGDGEFKAGDGKGKHTKAYKDWAGMLKRCYDEKTIKLKPWYADCFVCDYWHNFQNFAKWHADHYPNDGGDYHIDKDIIVEGNKEYAPDKCKFVTPAENAIKARAKTYKIIDPQGNVVEVYNMRQFCLDNQLNECAMQNMIRGKSKTSQGWKLYKDKEV